MRKKKNVTHQNKINYLIIFFNLLFLSSAASIMNNNLNLYGYSVIFGIVNLILISFIVMIVPFIFRIKNKKRLELNVGKKICKWNSIILLIFSIIVYVLTDTKIGFIGGLGALMFYYINFWIYVENKKTREKYNKIAYIFMIILTIFSCITLVVGGIKFFSEEIKIFSRNAVIVPDDDIYYYNKTEYIDGNDEIYTIMLKEEAIEMGRIEGDFSSPYTRETTRKGTYNAQHILVSSNLEANEVINKLKKGKNFCELAKEYSIDNATSKNCGNLGYFKYEDMVEEFSYEVTQLEEYEYTMEAVETEYGFHIIKRIK